MSVVVTITHDAPHGAPSRMKLIENEAEPLETLWYRIIKFYLQNGWFLRIFVAFTVF